MLGPCMAPKFGCWLYAGQLFRYFVCMLADETGDLLACRLIVSCMHCTRFLIIKR